MPSVLGGIWGSHCDSSRCPCGLATGYWPGVDAGGLSLALFSGDLQYRENGKPVCPDLPPFATGVPAWPICAWLGVGSTGSDRTLQRGVFLVALRGPGRVENSSS